MDNRFLPLAGVLLLNACAGPVTDAPPTTAAPTPAATPAATPPPSLDLARLRERLAPIASCAIDEETELWRRVWCQGARVGTEPLPEPPPSTTLTPLLGLSFGLPADGDLKPAIAESVPLLAVLLLSTTTARVVRVGPETDEEKRDIESLLFASATLLAGDHGRAEGLLQLPESLRGFVGGLLSEPAGALTWGADVAAFRGAMPSFLFVVRGADRHDAIITVEEAQNGVFVSLFPFVPVTP